MQYINFQPLGKKTSRIGLGCGRLVGRSSLRSSAKILETALDLGIRYFDVAPSYGMGTAEEVIGSVIGDLSEVTIATKVGISRPSYCATKNLLRQFVKPVLCQGGSLKMLAQRFYTRSQKSRREPKRFDFSTDVIYKSLQESLEKLRRDSVDVCLAHEPHSADLCEEIEQRFQSLREAGLITAYGVGVGAIGDRRGRRFGTIWQSCWPGESAQQYKKDVAYIWHGAIRLLSQSQSGMNTIPPSSIVRTVLEQSPDGILLVSVSSPARLKELLQEI